MSRKGSDNLYPTTCGIFRINPVYSWYVPYWWRKQIGHDTNSIHNHTNEKTPRCEARGLSGKEEFNNLTLSGRWCLPY